MTAQPDNPIWAEADRPILPDDWSRDGNAFALLGAARKAQRDAGWTNEQQSAWRTEAESSDYDHLVQTILAWHDQED